jgi:hypothetical protein
MVALHQPSVLPPKPPLFKTSTQRWAMLEPVTTHEELSRFDFPVLLLTGDRSSNHSRVPSEPAAMMACGMASISSGMPVLYFSRWAGVMWRVMRRSNAEPAARASAQCQTASR